MRGEGAPSPIYEGEDSVDRLDAWTAQVALYVSVTGSGRAEARHHGLPTPRNIRAEYQSQALIDLAFRLGKKIGDWEAVEEVLIETSHHTHYVIGTGANDPQKFDPQASAKRSTIRSCISSPSPCRTAHGIT